MAQIRLDRFLANAGIGTRSEVKNYIRKGQVCIGSETVKKADLKIDPAADLIYLNNQPVSYQRYQYYMLHKPAGCVTATKDNHSKTVMDYLDFARKEELFPVGRLDRDTEGLLLITNDGDLAHQLLAPKKHVDKTYAVRVDGALSDEEVKRFQQGLDIGDEKLTLPAQLVISRPEAPAEALVTIHEGRFHQIKRMFKVCGREVIYLKRLSMGPLVLDQTLAPGSYRALTEEEIRILRG